MTRNREIDCDDLRNCDHSPQLPITEDGELAYWLCSCGETRHQVGAVAAEVLRKKVNK